MTAILLPIIDLFPISFLIFVFSERINAIHQSRVGKSVSFSGFLGQSWTDSIDHLKAKKSTWYWVAFALQISIVFFLESSIEYLLYLYFLMNAFCVTAISPVGNEAIERVEHERGSTRAIIGAILSFFCVTTVFVSSRTTAMSGITWSPFLILFLPLFLIAGMIFFGEQPFTEVVQENSWVKSARFYVWCLLASQLYLGGSEFYLDLHLKAAILFVACRLIAQYVPVFRQRDLIRLSVLYLIPISMLLFLCFMVGFAVLNGDVNV